MNENKKINNFKYLNIKIIIIIFLLFFAILFNSKYSTFANNPKTIVTTIYPYYLLTKEIVKDKFDVVLFIPPNSSPHTFSPKPNDIIKLNQSNLIIANGLSLEENLKSKLKYYKDKVIYCSNFLIEANLLSPVNDKNPHIWLDPIFITEIAKGITSKIIEIDPKNKQYYLKNLELVTKNILNTFNYIENQRKKINKKIYIITLHNSFKYFAKRFNIVIAGVVESSPGKEPGIKELIALGDIIKKYQIKTIFSEPQLNPKPVKVLSKEYNLKIYNLDPIGYSLNIKKIEQLYLYNWDIIFKSLNNL